MLFTAIFKFIYDNILMNILLIILVIWFGIWAYNASLKSRKYYICPNCGESFRTEHMNSKCCKVCGTPLELKSDDNVNDSAV